MIIRSCYSRWAFSFIEKTMKTIIIRRLAIFTALLAVSVSGFAYDYGVQVNYLTGQVITSHPPGTKQYGMQLQWFPKIMTWKNAQFFIQGGYEHLTTTTRTNASYATSLNDFAAGLMFRTHFQLTNGVSPYFVIGSEPGYLNENTFGNRQLGSHFTFRDTIGFGLMLGEQQQVALGFYFIHYSHLFNQPNPGITLPGEFSITYQF